MEKTGKWPDYRTVWDLNPNTFCVPDYYEFQKDLKGQFDFFKKFGISKEDLMEVWDKCAVNKINFTSDTWRIRGCGTICGEKGVPGGWQERYGSDVGYWIELRKMEPSEIRTAVKTIAEDYPGKGWGIKITLKEFYRVLFFHEVAHTLPICGRYLNELAAMPVEEKLKFEREAWLWGVKMARRKNPKIKVLCYSRKKEDKLEHSNFCQWYQLLKRDEEFRKRQKVEAVTKKAA